MSQESSDDPRDHNFNWVKAQQDAPRILAKEFSNFRKDVLRAIEDSQLPITPVPPEVEPLAISAIRYAPGPTLQPPPRPWEEAIRFVLDGAQIVVKSQKFPQDLEVLFTVTLVHEGGDEHYYRIDGAGEYKRWEVVQRALAAFFASTEALRGHLPSWKGGSK